MGDGKYTFFYPNLCHVCTKRKKAMIICPKCRMISYCSMDHLKQHWPEHQQMCRIIQHELERRENRYPDELTSTRWYSKQLSILNDTALRSNRRLTHAEEQMFLYARACSVCHRQDGLKPCNNCPCANFCVNHRDDLEHAKYCETNNLVHRVDKYESLCQNDDVKIRLKFPKNKPFRNMSEFLRTQIEICTTKFNDITVKEVSPIHYSDYVTGPLTFYFSMKKLKCLLKYEKLVIHILASSKNDVRFAEQWMLLFFLIPTLKSLTITLIGRRVEENKVKHYTFLEKSLKNKEFFIVYSSMLYEKYVKSEDFEKPNFIIGFNAGTYDYTNSLNQPYLDDSMGSVVAIAEQKCPCILAFYETYTGPTKEKIDKMKPRFYGKNPFASLRPYRTTSGGIFYRNESLIIFDNLDSSTPVFMDTIECGLFF